MNGFPAATEDVVDAGEAAKGLPPPDRNGEVAAAEKNGSAWGAAGLAAEEKNGSAWGAITAGATGAAGLAAEEKNGSAWGASAAGATGAAGLAAEEKKSTAAGAGVGPEEVKRLLLPPKKGSAAGRAAAADALAAGFEDDPNGLPLPKNGSLTLAAGALTAAGLANGFAPPNA